ncbi:ymr253c-like protein [Stylonychia lemnae]|uniref:Ymr253c-like protein n=1 Tax=Stylonychia lemnae TaxID=5949 RepID=A0A078A8K3_STYLE|nr:ymr253c-like protein [Stylonychia lemnae]|eukprot:CDW78554.1 ymr253c-like protein [Stylonychia lemnae]
MSKELPNQPYKQISSDQSREIELAEIQNFQETEHAPKEMKESLYTEQSKSSNQLNQSESQQKFNLARAKGFFYMVISALMVTCMNLIIKYQAKHTQINPVQAVIMRSLFLAAGSYLHVKKDKLSIIEIPRKFWGLIIARAVFGYLSSICLYAALDFMPLSQCITVYYTQPIFVAIACYVILGEKLAKLEMISIFSAMFGVVLLIQPQLIVPSLVQERQTLEDSGPNNLNHYFIGTFLSLSGALAVTVVFIVCRKIGKDLHVSVHSFYFAMALQIEKGGRSASVNYLVVVNAFLADVAIFGESVVFTDILGALCIVFFTFFNAFLKCFGQSK